MRRPVRHRPNRRPMLETLEGRTHLSAGDLDPSFDGDGRTTLSFPGVEFDVREVAVQSDGKVLVAGRSAFGVAAVARLNVDGSPDASFGAGGIFSFPQMRIVYGLALQADGKIVMAGLNPGSGFAHFAVGRLTPDGALDRAFSGDGVLVQEMGHYSSANDVAVQRDGKIVVCGSRMGGLFLDDDFVIARYDADGSLDTDFNLAGIAVVGFGDDEEALSVAIDYHGTAQTNPLYGTIVAVGGESSPDASSSRFNVARLLPSGDLDGRFNSDGKLSTSFPGETFAFATDVTIQAGGKVVAVGHVSPTLTGSSHEFAVARYLSNGSLDTTFGAEGTGRVVQDLGGNDLAYGVAVGDHGTLLVGGVSDRSLAVAAFRPSGSLDTHFAGDGVVKTSFGGTVPFAAAIATGPGRKVVVAGGQGHVARYFGVAPVVNFLSFDLEANEVGQNTAAFLVVVDERLDTPLRVYLDVAGTATPPPGRAADYTGFTPSTAQDPRRGYVDIPAGDTFAQVIITPADDALTEGRETAVFSVRPDDAYDNGERDRITLTIDDNEGAGPARVSQVFANGPNLTAGTTANAVAFRNLAGIDSNFGYAVPAGAGQTRSVPWAGGVNRVALRFDRDVAGALDQGDLVVRGVNVATYGITGFTYDAATRTGVWTLAQTVANDKLRLFLDDARVAGLDGEWADGADAYPSGDGAAGGDFTFRLNVLAGDVTGEGAVNALDMALLKQKLGSTATNPGTGGAAYSVFADVAGDGALNALDLAAVKQRLGNQLPPGEPAAATALLSGGR